MKAIIDVAGLAKDFGTMVKVFPVETSIIVGGMLAGVVAARVVTRFDERKRLESWAADYENQRNQAAQVTVEMESKD